MEERRDQEPDVAAELRRLGENLRDTVRAAWDSAERQRMQSEIEHGLEELRRAVRSTFDEASHELGSKERVRQKVSEMRGKAAGMREELRGINLGDRLRTETHDVLRRANEGLERARERFKASSDPAGGPPGPPPPEAA